MRPDLRQVTAAIEVLVNETGGVERLVTPRGWPHLGLVIVDAVFSLQADYDTVVVPILQKYCDAAPDLDWGRALSSDGLEHDAQRLIDFLEPISLAERSKILNRQIGPGTAGKGRTPYRKAQIVVDVARTLVASGVLSRADFIATATRDSGLEWSVRRVPGVGFACWKYMLNLSGVEASKPDTMVLRWLGDVIGVAPSQKAGTALLEEATRHLQEKWPDLTIRQVDHLVWRKASGRSLTDAI